MPTQTIDSRQIPQIQYVTPNTGDTVSANTNGHVVLLINPSGSLLNLTVAFPANPSDGDMLRISTSQILTSLTLSGATIISALTTLALGGFASYCYSGTASKWFRVA